MWFSHTTDSNACGYLVAWGLHTTNSDAYEQQTSDSAYISTMMWGRNGMLYQLMCLFEIQGRLIQYIIRGLQESAMCSMAMCSMAVCSMAMCSMAVCSMAVCSMAVCSMAMCSMAVCSMFITL